MQHSETHRFHLRLERWVPFHFAHPTLLATTLSVIPAEAGIQTGLDVDSRLRGNDEGEGPGISRVYFRNNDRKRMAQDDTILVGQDSG